MLSFAGEATATSGVGDGCGDGMNTVRALREAFADVRAEALIPSAKVLSDKPATHAKAQVRTATFLKCLGIIPSSGILADSATTLARECQITAISNGRRTTR